jgi:DNA (cytosine-5)-methyltransferase 1
MLNSSALTAFDFFAGGGGASLGLHRAGINVLAALNHSPVAIATHAANFIDAKHLLCDIRVQKSWGLGHADIMWASPDCTHHSIAKGGQSRDAKERALAEELPRFAYNLNVNCIMVENVKEFLDWGPLELKRHKDGSLHLDKKGQEQWVAIKARKKEYYNAWVATLAALGFVNYEYRLLNAADFGVPQSRTRYFGIFTRRGVPIVWPKPTHDRHGRHGLPQWVAVRTVLDLNDVGRSIFTEWDKGPQRKPGDKPAEKTLRRYAAGLRKQVIGQLTTCYLDKRSSNPPSGKAGTGATIDAPSPTVATCYLPDLVTPRFLVKNYSGDPTHQSIALSSPASTVTCVDHHAVVSMAHLVHNYSGGGQSSSLSDPHPASTCNPHGRLITPAFVMQYNGGSDNCRALSLDRPLNVVPTENRYYQVQVQCLDQANGTRANDSAERLTMCLDGQAPTLNTNGGNLHLMSYYGKGSSQPLCRPCPTVCTHDRFALWGFVTGSGYEQRPYSWLRPAQPLVASRRHPYLLLALPGSPVAPLPDDSPAMAELKELCRDHGIADIYMRMLNVPELKRIMGFPDDYYLHGGVTKQKEMLGNAVVPQVSEAIARAMTPGLVAARLRKLPALRRAAVNRYEQGALFGKEVAAV